MRVIEDQITMPQAGIMLTADDHQAGSRRGGGCRQAVEARGEPGEIRGAGHQGVA
jgi:hypothetical protein